MWKQRIRSLPVLVLLTSLLPLLYFLFAQDLFHTHDGLVHLPRIGAYYKALSDGQILPRWAGDLNYGYGMPLFNFIYHTPYLVASFFILLGANLVWSFKLSLATSFLLSGIFMYLFARVLFKDSKKAFLVTCLYQFAPFHLVEVLIRGSFGEVYTYAFLPLVLFCIIKLNEKKSLLYFLLLAFSLFLLIISHNSISLVFTFGALLFALFFSKRKQIIVIFAALFTGFIASSFYWVPALFEHQYTFGNLYMKDLYMTHFAPFWYFIVPNVLKFKEFEIGAVSVQFGLFHLAAIIASIVVFRKTKDKLFKKIFIFCIILIGISIFFMQPVSRSLWENVSFLRQFQFPWRFMAIVVFASSLLGVSFFEFNIMKRKNIYVLVCGLIILSTIFYWKPAEGIDKINNSEYWNFPLTTTYYGETDVIWTAGEFKKYPKSNIEIISGEGRVSNYFRRSQIHTFTIDAKTKVRLVDNTEYFPDWYVLIDGRETPIQFQDPSQRGLITFEVEKGTHTIEVVFHKNPIRVALRELKKILIKH